jgi:hypothetical protein
MATIARAGAAPGRAGESKASEEEQEQERLLESLRAVLLDAEGGAMWSASAGGSASAAGAGALAISRLSLDLPLELGLSCL